MVAVLLADKIDGYDVRVRQAGDGRRFDVKAPHEVAVAGQLRGKDLDGHRPLERFIIGPIDVTHAAAADLLDNPIVAQPLERRGLGRTTGQRLLRAARGRIAAGRTAAFGRRLGAATGTSNTAVCRRASANAARNPSQL